MSIFAVFILALIISLLFAPGYRRGFICSLNNIFFRSIHGRYCLAVLDNSIWSYVVKNIMDAAFVHLVDFYISFCSAISLRTKKHNKNKRGESGCIRSSNNKHLSFAIIYLVANCNSHRNFQNPCFINDKNK